MQRDVWHGSRAPQLLLMAASPTVTLFIPVISLLSIHLVTRPTSGIRRSKGVSMPHLTNTRQTTTVINILPRVNRIKSIQLIPLQLQHDSAFHLYVPRVVLCHELEHYPCFYKLCILLYFSTNSHSCSVVGKFCLTKLARDSTSPFQPSNILWSTAVS